MMQFKEIYKQYFKPRRTKFFLLLGLVVFVVAIGNVNPYIYGLIIDSILQHEDQLLLKYLSIYICVLLLLGVLNVIQNSATQLLINDIVNNMKEQLFSKAIRLKLLAQYNLSDGELMNRIEQDVSIVINFYFDIITNILLVCFNLAFSLYFIFSISYVNALIAISIPVLSLIVTRFFQPALRRITKKQFEYSDKYINFLTHSFKDLENIKAFQIEDVYDKSFHCYLSNSRQLLRKNLTLNNLLQFFKTLINNVINTILIYVFSIRIMGGMLSIGNMVSFNTYVGKFFDATTRVLALNLTANTVKISIKRLNDIQLLVSEDTVNGLNVGKINHIEVKSLQFAYDKNPVLKNLSISITTSGLYSITGTNGCGKTTLFRLLMGMYECNQDSIFYNCIDINNISIASLRGEISYASKQNYITNDSIFKNIVLNDETLLLESVRDLCKKVELDDYIMSLPDKYDTILDSTGSLFSSGQKQRLSIVRALLRKASLYLLDEITSDLDYMTERKVVDLIQELAENKIVIMISHREYPLNKSKIIYAFNDGVLNFGGTFDEFEDSLFNNV